MPLTPTQFKLLVQLARRTGKVCSYPRLEKALWGAGSSQTQQQIHWHLLRLRRAFALANGQASRRLGGHRSLAPIAVIRSVGPILLLSRVSIIEDDPEELE